jgi:V8-like Glu-specific endopeptidase
VPATSQAQAAPPPPPPTDANILEVVHVLVDGDKGLCTGTLVGPKVVITAAHCLDPDNFSSWDVIAPLATNKAKVHGAYSKMFDADYHDVAKPDIGAIVLEEPITLTDYAVLTDISARVAGDATVMGTALVRKYIDVNAPLVFVPGLEASSDEKYGYDHGIVTKYFSEGGDSGAALFLIDNGVRTHQLIGVERQPEPSRNVDHFTRIDPDFIQWVKSLDGT